MCLLAPKNGPFGPFGPREPVVWCWPEKGVVMARILGDDGRELAEVTLTPGRQEIGDGATIARVSRGTGSLLRYYFEQGRRAVELDLGEARLRGTLSTC